MHLMPLRLRVRWPRPCHARGPARPGRGMTLVELMITIALLAILLKLAAPSFANWVSNARVRTVSDALQNGARLAQAEAVRRNRQVVFFLSNVSTCSTADGSAVNGSRWQIRTVPLFAGEPVVAVQCGTLMDLAGNVTINGPRAICFNSSGRQVANAAPGPAGAVCTLDAAGAASRYDLAAANSDRPQRVLVALGGQVRMCDPARVLGAGAPDGCPP